MSKEVKADLNARVKDEEDIALLPEWDGDYHVAYQNWLEDSGHIRHVASFWQHRKQQNVLMVHYNDLKSDLSGEMRRIANFLNIDVPPTLWPETVERCTFEAMRNDASRMGNFDIFKDGIKGFIFKGTNGRWRDILSTEELAQYDTRLQSEMSHDGAAWSVDGRSFLVGAANS